MSSSPPSPPSRSEAQRTVRYNHLVERLRGRQITMEEATELFTIMQGMLRASEAARLARASAPPAEEKPRPAPHKPAGVGLPASDDLLAVGILAMGAGAGLLAAITKKMSEAGAAGPSPPRGRGAAGSAKR